MIWKCLDLEYCMLHAFGQFLILGETVLDLRYCTSLHFSVICSFTDKPDPCGSGGSSNTAKTGKDFFSPKNRKEAALLWEVEVIKFTVLPTLTCSATHFQTIS